MLAWNNQGRTVYNTQKYVGQSTLEEKDSKNHPIVFLLSPLDIPLSFRTAVRTVRWHLQTVVDRCRKLVSHKLYAQLFYISVNILS